MEIIKLDINKIFVWDLNPRFISAQDIDFHNIKIDYDDDFPIIFKLLKNESDGFEVENDEDEHVEGNYHDFYLLCKSIIDNGFTSDDDTVYVKKAKDQDKYAILEGNRRISAIKILRNWNNADIIYKIRVIFSDEFIDKINTLIEQKRWDIKEFNSKTNEIEIKLIDENIQSERIWSIIYARHNNKKIGKSKWYRLKFLQDVKFHFKNLLKVMKIHDSRSFEKNFNEIKISMSEILNKSNIANDLKSSLWVTKSIEIYKKSIPNIEKIKISSFEISLNVIKDPENPTKKLCNYFDCSFDYFNWDFDITIRLLDLKYKKSDIINFLIDNYLNGSYTTRGWNKNKVYILRSFLYPQLYKNNEKIKYRNFTVDELEDKIKSSEINTENCPEINEINNLIALSKQVKNKILPFRNVLFQLHLKLKMIIEKNKKEDDNLYSSLLIFYSLIDALIHENINECDVDQPIEFFPFSKLSLVARSSIEKMFLILLVNDDARNFLIKQETISQTKFKAKTTTGEIDIDFSIDNKQPNFMNTLPKKYMDNYFIVAEGKLKKELQNAQNISDLSNSFFYFLKSIKDKKMIKFTCSDDEIANSLKSKHMFNDIWNEGNSRDPKELAWFKNTYISFLSMMIHWNIYDLWTFEIPDAAYINNWLNMLKNFINSLFDFIDYINKILEGENEEK